MRGLQDALAIILVFALGFLCCIGGIVAGGVFIYKNVSYSQLESWGLFHFDTSEMIDEDAEVDILALTPEKIVREIKTLSALDTTVTVDTLLERYGIMLSDNVMRFIPYSVRTLPLKDLTSKAGLNYLLENTTLDYALQFIPESVLQPAAREALAGKVLRSIIDNRLVYLLDGVDLGYIIGAEYDLVDDAYILHIEDPEHQTLKEMLAPVSLGDVMRSLADADSITDIIAEQLGHIVLVQFTDALGLHHDLLATALGDKSVADIFVVDESGKRTFSLNALLGDLRIGDLLGYHPQFDAEDNLVGWTDDAGAEIGGVVSLFANYAVLGLVNGEIDLGAEVNGFTIDKILGLTAQEYPTFLGETPLGATVVWMDEGGNQAPAAVAAIADTDASIGNLTSVMDSIRIGRFLGYQKVEGKWYSGSRAVRDGEDIYLLSEASGVAVQLADLTISDLSDSGKLTEKIKDTKLCDVMGYTRNADGEWVDGAGHPVNGFMAKLADKTVSELEGDSLMNDLTIADVMNFTYDEESACWRDADHNRVNGIMGALAGTPVSGLSDKIDTVKLGEVMNFTYDAEAGKWKDGDHDASGLMAAFADMTVSQLSDSDMVSEKVKSVEIGQLFGYTESVNYLGETTWKDGDTEVTGLMKILASKKVGEMDTALDEAKLGEIMGYVYYDGVWLDPDGYPATGMMTAFIDLTVGQLKNDPDTLINAVQGVQIGEAIGYTYDETNEVWLDGESEVTGIMGAIAGTPINGLGGKIETLTIAEVLNYHQEYIGGQYYWCDSNGYVVEGFLSLLDLSSPVTEIDTATTNAYKNATMGKLVDAGLLNLDETKLNLIPGWREMKLNDFLSVLLP